MEFSGNQEAAWIVMEFTLDMRQWAEEQFGGCQLGDQRRTRRAVAYAAQVAAHPSGSTPQQTEDWASCKAAYRLFDCEDVTFQAISDTHWRRTRERQAGHYLLLGDTSEITFGGKRRQVEGLGPTGDGGGRGFFLHSSLLIEAEQESIIGLAGGEIFHRRERPRSESRYDRTQRRRESEVWGRVIDQVGPPPPNVAWTHVFDRGADNFEVFCHLVAAGCEWVVRATQLHRRIEPSPGASGQLGEYLRTLAVVGCYELELRAREKQAARTAHLEVRHGRVTLPAPRHLSPYLRKCGIRSISMQVIEVREVEAPAGVTPLYWVLLTSHDVRSFDDAWRVIEYYERRWLIEEFHKALKTGCRVKERQYSTSQRLEALTGLLSIVAVRLLQLKAVARSMPLRRASQVIPRIWIDALSTLRKRLPKTCTIREFYRDLAALGGFLGRKSDGEPGWMTLWRGFDKLAVVLRVFDIERKCG